MSRTGSRGERVLPLIADELTFFDVAAVAHGGLELVEGVGLWLRTHWAEWLTARDRTLRFRGAEVVKSTSNTLRWMVACPNRGEEAVKRRQAISTTRRSSRLSSRFMEGGREAFRAVTARAAEAGRALVAKSIAAAELSSNSIRMFRGAE